MYLRQHDVPQQGFEGAMYVLFRPALTISASARGLLSFSWWGSLKIKEGIRINILIPSPYLTASVTAQPLLTEHKLRKGNDKLFTISRNMARLPCKTMPAMINQ